MMTMPTSSDTEQRDIADDVDVADDLIPAATD